MAKETTRTISIRVNDIEPGKSIKKIKAEFKELRESVENADEKNEEYYKNVARLGQLKGAINKHNKDVRRIAKGWDETSKSVKKTKKGFGSALGEFLNFKNLTVAGLATTLVGAAAAFGQEILEVSKEINQLRGDIQNLTGLSGDELEMVTAQARALGEAFKVDSQEIVLAANAMSNEFGISFNESLQLVEKGFLAGADANGEFLSQMREYPAQFAAAGSSAENFVEIVTRSTKEGVFSDKGADVFKEFGLRIRDANAGVKKSMNEAFGKKFTSELFDNINSGAITTEQALQKVAGKMDATKIPANKLQAVVSNVFGGAGEDAGLKFIKSLEDVGKGMDAQIDKSNDLTNERIKQLEAEQELAFVQTQLSAEIQELTTGTGVFVTQLKTGLLTVVVSIIRQFQNWIKWGKSLYQNVWLIRTVVDTVSKRFGTFYKVLTRMPNIAQGMVASFKFLMKEFKDFGANMVSEAKIAIEKAKNIVGRGDVNLIDAEKAKIKARDDGKGIKDAFLEGYNSVGAKTDFEPESSPGNAPIAPPPTFPTSGGGGNQAPISETVVDENAKNIERLQDQIEEFRDQKRINQLSDDKKEIERIKAKYQKQIDLAKESGANEELKALIDLRNEEIEAKEAEHLAKIEAKEAESNAKKAADKLKKDNEYREAKKAIEGEVELELMSELERELVAIDAHYDALIEEAKQYGIDLSILKELEAQKNSERLALQRKEQAKSDKQSLEDFKKSINDKATAYQALGSIFGSVAQLMVDEEGNALAAQRVFALAEIAMNAATGIAGAISAGSGVPFPGNLVAIASGVGAVVTGITQARKVFAQQKKDGGYVEVLGADDGKKYNAKRIGKQSTGMLPASPVLLESEVLASEAGAEYFVSNKSLQNPAIMDLVRMIDNIESGQSVTQFNAGGSLGSIANDNSLITQLLSTMTELNDNISKGFAVKIGYKEIEKMDKLSNDLSEIN